MTMLKPHTDLSPWLLRKVHGRSGMLRVNMLVQGPVSCYPMPHILSLSYLWKPFPQQPDGFSTTLGVFHPHRWSISVSGQPLLTHPEKPILSQIRCVAVTQCIANTERHCMSLSTELLSSPPWYKYLHPNHPLCLCSSVLSFPDSETITILLPKDSAGG